MSFAPGFARRYLWRRGDAAAEILVEYLAGGRFRVTIGGRSEEIDCARLGDGRLSALRLATARQIAGRVSTASGALQIRTGNLDARIDLTDPSSDAAAGPGGPAAAASEIRTQMPGRIVEVRVREGETVEAGATLLVIEAMKMQNEIRAEAPARIKRLACSAGQPVEAGALLLELGEAG
jgi:glutaconyl-CoA/methylmalonyl-CoA decarboxylase subunit gamma